MTEKLDPGGDGETGRRTVRVPTAEWNAAKAAVAAAGTTISAVVRAELARIVQSHNERSDTVPIRKRFKPAEREQFTTGVTVEWCHGTVWVPARIADSMIRVDGGGGQYMDIEYTGNTTRTISKGAAVRGYPGHIRIPTDS